MKYTLLLLCLAAAACGSADERKYTVKVSLPDGRYDGMYVYLEKPDILSRNFPVPLDSALIRGGAFTISGTTAQMPVVLNLVIPSAVGPHHTLPVIVDKGVIHVAYDDLGASQKGGKIAQSYNDLVLAACRETEVKKNAIVAERDAKEHAGILTVAESDLCNERIREAYSARMPALTRFVRENIGNPAGWFFFFSASLDRYDETDRAELYAAIPDTLRAKYEEIQKARTDKQAYFRQSQEAMVPGAAARPVVGFDADGNRVSLADYSGRVVLIDIWASWCVPCIQEFPGLRELYAKYKDHGLEIIGFSVDKDGESWKNALVKHELPWVNISDLKAWDSRMIADYGIQAIPFTILIDRGGMIASRNIHAHNLTAAMEKLFPGI